MFWHMPARSTTSSVEAILDKEDFTLEELLDESGIIQECKALNGRLISFLRDEDQLKQLIKYIVEEVPENSGKERTFKFPFVASEIFTCEVDIILNALVENEVLMDLLFSFLDRERPHIRILAGYFNKVVVSLLIRKRVHLMNYIRFHQNIINKLVDLIGITSIMEVLIHLIDIDESVKWLEDINVIDMIVDKFSSSDCSEVHTNSAEFLCTITRYAPPGLASKISSPSFVGKLFYHALEETRPKSVLVNLLSVCICLLDPKRLSPGLSYMYGREMGHGSEIIANPETVQSMVERLGDLLRLLDPSSDDKVLLTTYGKLQPPFGKHRLKIVEFIAVLVGVSSEVAAKKLMSLNAINRILNLFFEYPYNNFLHHHVEQILTSCLESKNPQLVGHLLLNCNLIDKILEAERNSTLAVDASKPTMPAEGKSSPRIGNIGHLTRIANKLVQLGDSQSLLIQEFLKGSRDWVEWQTNVLLKRNAVENVLHWACGRPIILQERTRDSDDEDYQDKDFDAAALANNLNQAFQYNSNDTNEAQGLNEGVDEDMFFADESPVLCLGDEQESGLLITNSEGENNVDEASSDSTASPPTLEPLKEGPKGDIVEENKCLADTATSDEHQNTTASDELIPTPDSSGAQNWDQNTSTQADGDLKDELEIKSDDTLAHFSAGFLVETDGEALADDPIPKESSESDVNLQRSAEADEENLSKIDST